MFWHTSNDGDVNFGISGKKKPKKQKNKNKNKNKIKTILRESVYLENVWILYKLYQNDWYWDMTEFSDFFFNMLWTNLDLNVYIFEISIVLSSIRILVYTNSTFRWLLLKKC